MLFFFVKKPNKEIGIEKKKRKEKRPILYILMIIMGTNTTTTTKKKSDPIQTLANFFNSPI
jgi:hypothetical protein